MEGKFSENETRWEASVSATLAKARPDQIWPLFCDFFNIHKWFPGLTDCHGIHGVNGEVESIRYAIGMEVGDQVVHWSKERLIDIDHVERRLTYEFVDSTFGFKSYVATFKVTPSGDGGDEGENGCTIEWSFGADRPLEGVKPEYLLSIYQNWLNILSKNMEEDVTASTQESTVMAAEGAAASKWEGKASVKVKGTADQVWSLLADDFCSLNKIAPGLAACYKVEGEDGQAGLVRYCNFGSIEEPKFIHEKFLSIDPVQRCYTYMITDNNLGFTGHLASWKVAPIQDKTDPEIGCEIIWSYVLDPAEGFTSETYLDFAQSWLLGMKGKIEEAV